MSLYPHMVQSLKRQESTRNVFQENVLGDKILVITMKEKRVSSTIPLHLGNSTLKQLALSAKRKAGRRFRYPQDLKTHR